MKQLTQRQLEFLAKSARGMTQEEIAKECYVVKSTVKSTIGEARERLEVKTTLQCLCVAIAREELGLDHDGVCFIPNKSL